MHKTLQRLQRDSLLRNPPALDATVRDGQPSQAALKREIKAFEDELPERADAKLVAATLLLAHDYLDQAEKLLAKREDDEACFLIGVIYRRRGDYAEACRRFRLTRDIDLHLLIGGALLEDGDPMIARVLANFPNLVQGGRYNPTPMSGVVQQVCMGGHAGLSATICQVQAIELATCLAWAAGWGKRRLSALQRALA